MNLDRNICSVCGEKNFSDSEYNSEVQMCSDCFEREKNNETITLFSPDMLEKDMFETTQEYQERVNTLGWLEVGEVTLNSYDADTEMFTIALFLNHYITFKTQEIQIKIKRKEAKLLYETSKTHKLLAQIAITNGVLSFKELKFQDYNVPIPSIETVLYWIDQDSELIWEIKQDDIINRKYTWNEAFEYAKELNAKNYAGFNDWRVPTIGELKTLKSEISYKGKNNQDVYIIKILANNTYACYYWSNAPCIPGNSNAWGVYFSSGYASNNSKSSKNYVRCVRGKEQL